jgi:hypothetical protein
MLIIIHDDLLNYLPLILANLFIPLRLLIILSILQFIKILFKLSMIILSINIMRNL